jgi:hypothetical protein
VNCGYLRLYDYFPKTAETRIQELYFTQQTSPTFGVPLPWRFLWYGMLHLKVAYKSVLDHNFVLLEDSWTSSTQGSWTVRENVASLIFGIDHDLDLDSEEELIFRDTQGGNEFVVTIGVHKGRVSLFIPSPPSRD